MKDLLKQVLIDFYSPSTDYEILSRGFGTSSSFQGSRSWISNFRCLFFLFPAPKTMVILIKKDKNKKTINFHLWKKKKLWYFFRNNFDAPRMFSNHSIQQFGYHGRIVRSSSDRKLFFLYILNHKSEFSALFWKRWFFS